MNMMHEVSVDRSRGEAKGDHLAVIFFDTLMMSSHFWEPLGVKSSKVVYGRGEEEKRRKEKRGEGARVAVKVVERRWRDGGQALRLPACLPKTVFHPKTTPPKRRQPIRFTFMLGVDTPVSPFWRTVQQMVTDSPSLPLTQQVASSSS